jgi:hypothetical protein
VKDLTVAAFALTLGVLLKGKKLRLSGVAASLAKVFW